MMLQKTRYQRLHDDGYIIDCFICDGNVRKVKFLQKPPKHLTPLDF